MRSYGVWNRAGAWIRERAREFFLALSFMTRVPSPSWVGWNEARFRAASAWHPLAGWVVGGTAALVYAGARPFFPSWVAAFLAMAWTIWLTRGLHEDGWADFCDGFGGARDKQRILEIMRDPRNGSYGSMGLWVLLTGKLACLASFPAQDAPAALWAAHGLSRAFAGSFLFTHRYAGNAENPGRAGKLAGRLTLPGLLFVVATGTLPVFALGIPLLVPASLALMAGWQHLFGKLLNRALGGYTGDCLGAAQQIAELGFYLLALAWIA